MKDPPKPVVQAIQAAREKHAGGLLDDAEMERIIRLLHLMALIMQDNSR